MKILGIKGVLLLSTFSLNFSWGRVMFLAWSSRNVSERLLGLEPWSIKALFRKSVEQTYYFQKTFFCMCVRFKKRLPGLAHIVSSWIRPRADTGICSVIAERLISQPCDSSWKRQLLEAGTLQAWQAAGSCSPHQLHQEESPGNQTWELRVTLQRLFRVETHSTPKLRVIPLFRG